MSVTLDIAQPRVIVPSAEELSTLRGMFKFEGSALLVVLPPPPESAVLREVRGMVRTMETMAGDLKTVAKNQHELRKENATLREAKERLAAMHAEGLLTFVHKIDADAFKLLVAVLVQGDVAKAVEALGLDKERVRWQLRSWRARDDAYRALVELIKWRKGRRMAGVCEFKDALANVTAGTDRESVLSEVLSGLMSMTDGNWQDVCADLKVELRKLMC